LASIGITSLALLQDGGKYQMGYFGYVENETPFYMSRKLYYSDCITQVFPFT
jgi:hypothetical protein